MNTVTPLSYSKLLASCLKCTLTYIHSPMMGKLEGGNFCLHELIHRMTFFRGAGEKGSEYQHNGKGWLTSVPAPSPHCLWVYFPVCAHFLDGFIIIFVEVV